MLGSVKRFLAFVGFCALIAWTGLGFVAWSNVARRVTVVLSEEEESRTRASELAALEERLGTLHEDVRALAAALGTSLQSVSDALQTSQEEQAAALGQRIDALQTELVARTNRLDEQLREIGARREALAGETAPAVEPETVTPAREAALPDAGVAAASSAPPAAPAPPAPAGGAKPRKSFLAFTLPSDDFRFDERRTWTILPSLSRVGFDAKTTLHDFTATTSGVEGELEADLAHPDAAPRARVTVQAATLVSGNDDRDADMRQHLSVEAHPTLTFELVSFTTTQVDSAALRASGEVHGRMSIRGVTQDVVMPLKLSIDDARRLVVEGQMKLDLEHFQVPVPNKLGLITMEKEVQVWISLRLRANPRSKG